jgi:hypothetical protein
MSCHGFLLKKLLIFGNNTFSMIIDNLDDKRANWSAISDNVMGGISEVNFYEVEEGEEKFYRLEGTVSTANNGGFIQSVIRFPFNAEEYSGIKIKVKGTNDAYYVWIRTPSSRFPWDRYIASFTPGDEWSTVEIPFSAFKKSNFYMPKKMNISKIRTIAFAAYGKDFQAELDLAQIELY